jgi:hypothetical protein
LKTKGVGLGLNTCKQLCTAFEGDVELESTEGKGTTFTFTFKTGEPYVPEKALCLNNENENDLLIFGMNSARNLISNN